MESFILFVSIYSICWEILLINGQCDTENVRCGDNGQIYTLYYGDVTWDAANDYCQENHDHLATIRDQPTQDIIKTIAPPGLVGETLAWVGGRRSPDTRWRDVTGQLTSKGMSIVELVH